MCNHGHHKISVKYLYHHWLCPRQGLLTRRPRHGAEKIREWLGLQGCTGTTYPSLHDLDLWHMWMKPAMALLLINLSQIKPLFLCVCSTSLLKTPWKKGKLLVLRNFCFFHSVFCPFGQFSAIFIQFKTVVCKLANSFSLLESKICHLGKTKGQQLYCIILKSIHEYTSSGSHIHTHAHIYWSYTVTTMSHSLITKIYLFTLYLLNTLYETFQLKAKCQILLFQSLILTEETSGKNSAMIQN